MRSVQAGLYSGLAAAAVLLCALAATVGLGWAGWLVGVTCCTFVNVALYRGLTRAGAAAIGPANVVTLTRATLVGGVAALTAESFLGETVTGALVGLTIVALALDGVDGWTARRTGTASDLGARFDWGVGRLPHARSQRLRRPDNVGGRVLAIGEARVRLRGRRLGAAVAAPPPATALLAKGGGGTQGIALVVAATAVLPTPVAQAALVGALALLAESFGRDVVWLWRRRVNVAAPNPSPEVDVRIGGTE